MKKSPLTTRLFFLFFITLFFAACGGSDPHVELKNPEGPTGIGGTGGGTPSSQEMSRSVVQIGFSAKQSSASYSGVTFIGPLHAKENIPVEGNDTAFDESLLDFGEALSDLL